MAKITVEDVLKIAKELPEDRLNPVMDIGGSDTCVYTAPNGEHCIVGEILTRLGQPLPAEYTFYNWQPFIDLEERYQNAISEEAMTVLVELQERADYDLPWGTAVKECLGNNLEHGACEHYDHDTEVILADDLRYQWICLRCGAEGWEDL